MDSTGLKRKDTTKGPPLRILSLDGGGVRGYSMFLIIQELMHRTFVEIEGRAPRRTEIPKPCEHFDLIIGTGTGGLIALMLGRMRLDLETCKELYVRMTRMVFETDKTIAGIPYRSTLFKATKLEEAIKEAVREHTVSETEGNDGVESGSVNRNSVASRSSAANPRRHQSNASVVSFSARSPSAQNTRPMFSSRGGNPNARLYDERENRTKIAVTAIYRGTQKGGKPALLRSYDSRREPAPEFDCKIWEAGRATCAIGLAFKPIQIGQSVFHDDGAGHFNPSITALDEAVVNEWPGREVGVFVSVGTGKRPKSSGDNASLWYDGFLGEYADAKKKLVAKIEGCEKIHEQMKREHLARRGVNIENYYRFNVEVGVGEFAMNEWSRLAEISTSTRQYMAREDEQRMVQSASAKMAKIHLAKLRWERMGANALPSLVQTSSQISMPLAVELPGDVPFFPLSNNASHVSTPSRQSYESGAESLPVLGLHTPSPRSSGEQHLHPSPQSSSNQQQHSPRRSTPPSSSAQPLQPPPLSSSSGRGATKHEDSDRLMVTAPTPAQYRTASGADLIAIVGADDQPRRYQQQQQMHQPQQHLPQRIEPPPLPPKTPLLENQKRVDRRPPAAVASPQMSSLPYPDDDAPPPMVDMARKPNYRP
ncbi:acyl transferase/acyl hydrolase/lysophospholipase [Bombardia bombarda]|uniref:Acyl transferase/acyl hydrolase/lysophospholipase n=1 Tax=Bombardia bombarda TaxID=252184 RepID=A0AA39WII7_9PEZI|nr:acyl transferase/acyl hydrolase/lysophospholipase [Bombardia bombarda]